MNYLRPHLEQLAGYVSGEQPQSGKFIKLNTNENPYPPSPAVIRAIETAARSGLGRYPDPVATTFRHRAGELLNVEPESIICGNGSDELLTMLVRATVGEGQLVRTPYPSYVLYRTLAEIQAARCEEVPFQSDWSLPDAFSTDAAGLRLVLLPNPNSPSGTVVSRDAVRDMAGRLPCLLVVDEAYVDFADADCLSLARECENVVVTRTLSKSYALAGLRFGFAVAASAVIAALHKIKDSYNCDALSIAAATAALDDQDWLRDTTAKIKATRARLTSQLRELGFEVTESQANFVWCTHPARPAKTLYDELKARHILVRYMEYPGWGDGLRISVGTDEQIDACLTLLGELL